MTVPFFFYLLDYILFLSKSWKEEWYTNRSLVYTKYQFLPQEIKGNKEGKLEDMVPKDVVHEMFYSIVKEIRDEVKPGLSFENFFWISRIMAW